MSGKIVAASGTTSTAAMISCCAHYLVTILPVLGVTGFITLETHTQPLDDDQAKTATLLADGKPSRPHGWEGAPPGGHHRKGVLRFEAVTPRPQAVELQIRRTGGQTPESSAGSWAHALEGAKVLPLSMKGTHHGNRSRMRHDGGRTNGGRQR